MLPWCFTARVDYAVTPRHKNADGNIHMEAKHGAFEINSCEERNKLIY